MRQKTILLLLAATLCLTRIAGAETYPDRLIRIVVPTGPGGAADIVSRMIADRLQTSLHQTVIVENRPGANGIVGASYVLSAPADGYMMMMGHIGLMTINQHIYKDIKFDPLTAFTPVSRATTYPNVLVVNNKLPVKSVTELIAYAKKNPNTLKYSSSGFGGSFHMGMEMLKAEANFDAVHVPYTGTALALSAVVAGDVEMGFTDAIVAQPQVATNTLRGIAISGQKRSAMLPDLPTVAESGGPGLKNFDVIGWNGLVVKAGTPPERVKMLNEHIQAALNSPDIVARISKLGADVAPGSPEDFGQFMQAESTKWAALARNAHLAVDNK
ncbi:MAG: tripartite tricarboxylate transporter substrate binding protein [Pseudolabrys sp.]